MKKIIIISVLLAGFIALGFWYWQSRPGTATTSTGKINVVASFYPLAFFAERIGGDFVTVSSITPSSSEPHDYEPTPREIIRVRAADVFIYNGAGLDPWAEKVKADVSAQGGQVVSLSDGAELLPPPNAEEAAETPTDPHLWLDPILVEQLVGRIRDAMISADGTHAAAYQANAATLTAQLAALDTAYQTGLTSCQRRDIYTSHAAFGYLAKRYKLTQVSMSGISPEEEPSAGRIAELAQTAKEQGITTIFFETLVSPALAETLAKEVGAKTAVLDPIEGVSSSDAAAGANYLTIMQSNLDALRLALNCQ